jgi:3-oxoacyl-[acyl-carrier protein] reductase
MGAAKRRIRESGARLMDLGLHGRVALVAGSSQGIGLAVARALLKEGARVVMTGRDGARLRAAVESTEAGDSVLGVAADLADGEAIASVLRQVRDRWGTLDVLVANIGSGTARKGWDLTDRDWALAFDVNLHATRRLVEAVLPDMLAAGRGSIVMIASIVGRESVNAPLPYSAAKAALVSYAKNLGREVARRGVRVNAVAPGNVLFDGGSWARKLAENPDAVRQYIDQEVPAGRFADPTEIADVVAFLASDRAAFVAGACVDVDGGQTRSY